MNMVPLNHESKINKLSFDCNSRAANVAKEARAAVFVWVILNSVVFRHQTCSASSEAFVRLSVVSVHLKPFKYCTHTGQTHEISTIRGCWR